jgi:nucleotide-binding universal stress UspA family protein
MRSEIVVGVDGSPTGQLALLWAAREASIRTSSLVIAHADDAITGGVVGLGFRAALADPAGNAAHLVEDAAALVRARFTGLQVTTTVQVMAPAQLLIGLSESAELVVLGSHNSTRLVGALLGSTALATAGRACCPVVLVGTDVVNRDHRCLALGVSASPGGQAAARFAFAEAARRDAALLAVRGYGVWGDPERGGDFGPLPGLRLEQECLLERVLHPLQLEFPQVVVKPRLVAEPIQNVMPHIAQVVDLIVLGRPLHQHPWSRGLGQITSIVPHDAPCPVVVVGAEPIPTDSRTKTSTEATTQRSSR